MQSPFQTPFTISASPTTDLWRKPPTTDADNAPIRVGSTFALRDFRRVRVALSASWTQRYDQGGVVLRLKDSHSNTAAKAKPESFTMDSWLKAGVEFYNNAPCVSVVATDRYSDWSVLPLDDNAPVTLELVREGGDLGKGMWVYQVLGDGERKPLREVCWFFAEEEGIEVEIGAYAARPAKEGDGDLVVKFLEFEVEATGASVRFQSTEEQSPAGS